MKQIAYIALTICCLGSTAYAQVAPSASGSTVASAARGMQYAFRYAENALLSPQYGNQQTSVVSGSVAYANRNQEKPFNMDYAGGYTWALSGPGYQTGQFHRMFLSQGVNFRRWNFLVSDSAAYLPQSPTTGFSGIAGTGETIGLPNPLPSTSQTILTVNTHVLSNSASGRIEHSLNYATTVAIGGGSDYLHFPDNNGIETLGTSGSAEINRRINARTSLLGRYTYSLYEFPGTTVSMNTHTALAGIRRRVTRNLSLNAFSGPQWIDSTVRTAIPANTAFVVNAGVDYLLRYTSINATYIHGTNGGGGYLIGGTIDNGQGNLLHQFGPNFTLGFTGGYMRTAAFNNNGVTSGAYGGTQATWWLGRNMIVFANYTGTGQTTTSLLPGNALNQTIHNISFGFGLSSREQRVRP